MINNEEKYNRLTRAAETIYKFFQKDKGFYSGKIERDGKTIVVFNRFEGAKTAIEEKRHRPLTRDEITVLALAIGGGPTPSLTKSERESAFEALWGGNTSGDGGCILLDRLITFM